MEISGSPGTATAGSGAGESEGRIAITVNGEPRELAGRLTIRELLTELALPPGPVAVERNGEVVPRARHGETRVELGDTIEVVHFVGGG